MKSKASQLNDTINKAVDGVSTAVEKGSKTAQSAASDAADATSSAVDTVVGSVSNAAKDAADKVSSSLKLAKKPLVRAVDSAGDSFDSVVHYLNGIHPNRTVRKATALIKKHPLKTVAVTLGLGLLFGRAFKRARA